MNDPRTRLAYLDSWRDLFREMAESQVALPSSLIDTLSEATGIPAQNLRAGIGVMCCGWAQLRRSPFMWNITLDASCRVTIVAAGNIPGVAVAPAVMLAAAGCVVQVKLAAADRWLLPWLLEQHQSRSPETPDAIHAAYHPPDSPELQRWLTEADRVLAFGSDETVATLKQQYGQKVIGFGHKFSVALVDASQATDTVLRGLAYDVLLFRQAGCLSAQAVFVVGDDAPRRWLDALSAMFDRVLDEEFGRPPASDKQAMQWSTTRDVLDLSGAEYLMADDRSYFLAVQPQFNEDLLLGNGFVQIIPVTDVTGMLRQLEPRRGQLQGCALAMEEPMASLAAQELGRFGFSHVCPPGELQAPPLDWPNGGALLPEAVFQW
ncbi:MAG: acyl-CoA reductase [candidate division KSB1 bacterium]|nr:acyl-CoA reductase [candidate division KSB1 bacterium]